MTPQEIFWYWINERHSIYILRSQGCAAPWTRDSILQTYKFTNVFRELDRTTVWCRENLRGRFEGADLILVMALFRQTGTIRAGELILEFVKEMGGRLNFRWEVWAPYLHSVQVAGEKIFTGAYMQTAQYPGAQGRPKIYSICEHALQPIWDNREWLYRVCREDKSLRSLVHALAQYPGWGGNHFMGYEVACDLRWTPVLWDAEDVMTWANPGPGAQRGLNRLHGRPLNKSIPEEQCVAEMRELLGYSTVRRGPHVPPLEMRDIEHSLCEVDKYLRVAYGEGRPRSLYNGKGEV